MKRILPVVSTLFLYFAMYAQPYTTPYQEGFLFFSLYPNTTLINGWTQSTNTSYQWYAENGGTASATTGPAFDHSVGMTGTFMYTEASGGTIGSSATLTSPGIIIPNGGVYEASFWYHMFGAGMGTLTVNVFDVNDSSANNLQNAFSISGQQHSSDSAAWTQAVFGLNQFAGDTVKLQFVGIRGNSFTSDLAIDDVEVRKACGTLVVIDSVANDFCGQAAGFASAYASLNQGIVSYSWSNGATTQSISGLTAGTYSYTVQDDSCTRTGSVIVNNISTITGFAFPNQYPSCGQANGSAIINATSNYPPISYLWSNGDTTMFPSGLAAGVYNVTATDASGCQLIQVLTLVDFNNLWAYSNTTHSACNDSTGSATITPVDSTGTGGSYTFSYNWSNGANTQTITNLSSGTYYYTVTNDTTTCTYSDSLVILDSCGVIKGNVYADLNGNLQKDSNEVSLSGVQITLNPGGLTFYTDINGNYCAVLSDYITYTVGINVPNTYVFCPNFGLQPYSLYFPTSSTYIYSATLGNSVSLGNDFMLTPPADSCGTISGHIWHDDNQDGSQNGTEQDYAFKSVNAGTYWGFADVDGDYTLQVPFNTAVTVAPTIWSSTESVVFPTSGDYNITLTNGSPTSTGNDFGIFDTCIADGGLFSLATYYGTAAGQCFHAWMDFKFTPCDATSNTDTCILTIHHDSLAVLDPNTISITPTTIGADYVQWVFPPGTAPSFHCMQMDWKLDSTVAVGQTLNWYATYYCGPDSTDGNNSNNTKQTIVTATSGPLKTASGGSYNINSMISSDEATILPYEIEKDIPFISYEILFTNVTTDTAFCMTLINEIPDELDINTLSYPFSSMPFNMYRKDRTVYIEYDNILLSDTASYELGSYGFLQYNIGIADNVTEGTVIDNEAQILFNNYDPITTNVVSHKVKESTEIDEPVEGELTFEIAPNPNNGQFSIVFNKEGGINRCDLTIFNMMGAEVYQELDVQSNSIDVSDISQGVYLVKLNVNGRISTKKMVVE